MDNVEEAQLDFSIVSPQLTVEAMRDSGYKDTDHAVAELIDNSIEAEAKLIELIAAEVPADPSVPYSRARIGKIAVVDDGQGMDAGVLRRSLRFGDGTRLDRKDRGIGRFGVGLPNASISQCTRVDIWTWQNGADNALHCYLDLNDVRAGEMDVPEPTHQSVPDSWRNVSAATSEQTGTLVVWSELDRVQWRSGRKTLERTEQLCGRIYRKFITDPEAPVEITLTLVEDDGTSLLPKDEARTCLPNDPLYLMSPSSTPAPFDTKSMFQLYNERTWSIPTGKNDDPGEVHVRCTMARPDAINEKKSETDWPKSYPKAGSAPWGKHADRNKGVSIVRSRRELELSQAWVNSYEPEERWWSVEVEFDPVLDEIFGVVNNKQHAHAFESGAGFKWEEVADPGESYGAFTDRLEEMSDPRRHLIEIWTWIDEQVQRMRTERKTIMKGSGGGGGTRHPTTGEEAEDVATNVINEQAGSGDTGTSDAAPASTDDQKISDIASAAAEVRGVDPKTAKEWAESTVSSGRRVLMKAVTLGHKDAFFDVEAVNDVIEVWLNDMHPVYEHFIEVITAETEDQTLQELAERLDKAAFTFRMLLFAWARYEDKAPMNMKNTLEDSRMDWGREARKFFDALNS